MDTCGRLGLAEGFREIKTAEVYTPLYLGLDYKYKYSHKNYKQAVFQIIKRAKSLNVRQTNLGITGSTEKKRYGASPFLKKVFVQMQDSYNQACVGECFG